MRPIPESRLHVRRDVPWRRDGRYVVYWMIAARRLRSNYALQRAIALAREHHKPLVILEPLRVGYRFASDRLHRFVIDGMAEHQRELAGTGIEYYPYVEPEAGAGKGLLAALAAEACAIVTDDFPGFFLPRMVDAATERVDCRLEAVDSNGLVPIALPGKAFATAYAFRRWIQSHLPELLGSMAATEPLAGVKLPALDPLPDTIEERWPRARGLESPAWISQLPLDHSVGIVEGRQGGTRAALRRFDAFLTRGLPRYTQRNQPEASTTSELSAHLHFGHVGSQELFDRIVEHEGWTPSRIQSPADGRRAGWWGMSAEAEAWLDQLVTWRELGLNAARWMPHYDEYRALPGWARDTLEEHADDPRPSVYTLEQFENAQTHDPLWNAAQNQLLREGQIHNYLRMLWGKKILHWSRDPVEALETMLQLNDKYALDGRDPNSVSGIFWILGRYDRPWGPERAVFGKVRYMSSDNTARKLRVKEYVRRYQQPGLL